MASTSPIIKDRFQELPPDIDSLPPAKPFPFSSIPRPPPSKQPPTQHLKEEDFGDSIDDPIELAISIATSLKESGNREFNHNRWQLALNKYTEAIVALPLPKPSIPSKSEGDRDDDHENLSIESNLRSAEASNSRAKSPESTSPEPKLTSLGQTGPQRAMDPRITQIRSVLNANSAACYLKLEDWQSAVDACGASLRDNPTYAKALHRRAQANEKLGTWASLQASLDDYNALEKLPNITPELKKDIRASQIRLPPLITKRSEVDKAEMMSKLKDLGNTVLGKFGMSTDNFKFTPNESGGYSMSFQR